MNIKRFVARSAREALSQARAAWGDNAVVLLADKPDNRLSWDQATAWAAGLNAVLPSRPTAAMLFANLKASFDGGWHWTSDVDPGDGSYAWNQIFDDGFQGDGHKSYEGRARAVRLIQLTA